MTLRTLVTAVFGLCMIIGAIGYTSPPPASAFKDHTQYALAW